jgi:hypothetical protein
MTSTCCEGGQGDTCTGECYDMDTMFKCFQDVCVPANCYENNQPSDRPCIDAANCCSQFCNKNGVCTNPPDDYYDEIGEGDVGDPCEDQNDCMLTLTCGLFGKCQNGSQVWVYFGIILAVILIVITILVVVITKRKTTNSNIIKK